MKNGETFDRLEAEVKGYPEPQIQSAINETKTIMETFARGLIEDAIEKDRVLRGDGINFPPPTEDRGNASQFCTKSNLALKHSRSCVRGRKPAAG